MSILVMGGAGYVGSHTVAELVNRGEDVVVIDNLVTGHREAVLEDFHVPFYQLDIHDTPEVTGVIRQHGVTAVVHFAASSLVPESVVQPLKYYWNNVEGSRQVLASLVECGVKSLVFSSTAAVYGSPARVPIAEDDEKRPLNPYGETKLAVERMLHHASAAYGLNTVSLRYFNAAGAHPDLPIGEDHRPESHLIPIVLQAALNQRDAIRIYGDDYDTNDGTCVRDYIHVCDLAAAHRLALQYLDTAHPGSHTFNLGNGQGFSVREVIERARDITGHDIPEVAAARRPGDPARLVADASAARAAFGWEPARSDLNTILMDAWRWHRDHPTGYDDAMSSNK